MKPIIDEKLIYFAYFNDEPVGFFIMVPDLNRVIGRFHGKMNLVNKLRLMAILKCTHKADRVFAIIFGVAPEYHGRGIESGIMHEFEQTVARGEIHYKTLELAWMGDFNPVDDTHGGELRLCPPQQDARDLPLPFRPYQGVQALPAPGGETELTETI